LRERAERLAEADRHRTEFLAVLGHELRNPLAALRSGVEVLRTEGAPAAEQAAGVLERQLRQLTGLVDDLLDAGRVTRGRLELRRQAVDLAEVVARAVEAARPLAAARGQRREVALPPGPSVLEGDPVRLVQVFTNLLHNAAKYTDPGGHIALSAAWAGGEAVVRVRDNGMGIAPALLPRLFEPFVQGDRSAARSQGGLGIGLALVRRLVELHGGAVEAHSAGVGRGSEFVVRLPLRPPPPPPAPPPAAPAPAAPARRVLVVDDNADAALMLALLRARGHDVRSAHNGPAALEEAVTFRPEAVVLDIGLPGMDGYEVARRLRQLPERCCRAVARAGGRGEVRQEVRKTLAEPTTGHDIACPAVPKPSFSPPASPHRPENVPDCGLTGEHLAHLAGQGLAGEGLLQEVGLGLQHAVADHRVVGVAGQVQHLQPRPQLAQPLGLLAAAPGITRSVTSRWTGPACSAARLRTWRPSAASSTV
jgi:CheY-like chemotaxis protein/two-component sensor histidine kinase